jgi:pyridinium-3,5-bisthiocarboxylic acid mononucleotide nickel chelatase
MRVLYFDCFAGASGDMIIGALLDLGVSFDAISSQLASLDLSGYRLGAERVKRCGIACTKFNVEVDETRQPERTLGDICSIIENSTLSEAARLRAVHSFERLAQAEARIHAVAPHQVHFHEVGAVDSIIDTVGAMIGFELLGVDRFCASSLRLGYGSVDTRHGRLPVPAPATAELLKDVSVYAGDIEGEFVTPTGAAILTTLCEHFAPMPSIEIKQIGYGAGSRDPEGFPNALRLVLGESKTVEEPAGNFENQQEIVTVIETNIDDMNPQVFGFVIDRAFALSALDAFITPVQMKKGRPGMLLTVLSRPEMRDAIVEMLLRETTTLGVRYHETARRVLERSVQTVETRYGPVRIKVARDGGRTLHFQPEYDDCVRLAEQHSVGLLEVQEAASVAYREKAASDESNGERKEKQRRRGQRVGRPLED